MTEESLKQALAEAYPDATLSDDRVAAISRQVQERSTKRQRRKISLLAGLAIAIAATVGFTFPIAAANLLGEQIAFKIESTTPYQVQITALATNAIEKKWNRIQFQVIVDGKIEYIRGVAGPGLPVQSGNLKYFDADRQMHVVQPLSRVDVTYPPPKDLKDADGFFRAPITLMEKLRGIDHFDITKRIEDLGTKKVNGRSVHELALKTDGKVTFIADLDAQSDALVSMTIPSIKTLALSMPTLEYSLHFDYSYDSKVLKKSISDFKSQIAGMRRLSLDGDRDSIQRDLLAHPLASWMTGRDVLRIYQVQEDPDGNVFVLYSCRGYHADQEMQFDWLQLKDRNGSSWPAVVIDMNFSKLGLINEGFKALVFYNPKPSVRAGKASLSLRLNQWEYLRQNEPSTPLTRTLQLGSFTPTEVPGVPIWFFYAFNGKEESWVKATVDRLRSGPPEKLTLRDTAKTDAQAAGRPKN